MSILTQNNTSSEDEEMNKFDPLQEQERSQTNQ